jgi:hypothetical protein
MITNLYTNVGGINKIHLKQKYIDQIVEGFTTSAAETNLPLNTSTSSKNFL